MPQVDLVFRSVAAGIQQTAIGERFYVVQPDDSLKLFLNDGDPKWQEPHPFAIMFASAVAESWERAQASQ